MLCPKCGQEYEGDKCPRCSGPQIIVNNSDYLRRKKAYEEKQAGKKSASSDNVANDVFKAMAGNMSKASQDKKVSDNSSQPDIENIAYNKSNKDTINDTTRSSKQNDDTPDAIDIMKQKGIDAIHNGIKHLSAKAAGKGKASGISKKLGKSSINESDNSNEDIVKNADIRKRNKLLEDKVSQLEYELLKGKLPKQFMLNLLTTVSSFSILENASRTENITAEMASVLRYYLDNSSEVISLSEELKQIECYLDILRQQYDNRLEYRVYCQKEVEKQKIPIIGIFPFVEQLVDFGILAGHFRGTLYIDAEKKEDFCKVVLQLESSGLSVGHFGADITDGNFAQMQEQDTRKRYEREFGKDFEITADPNVITIQIPFQEIK